MSEAISDNPFVIWLRLELILTITLQVKSRLILKFDVHINWAPRHLSCKFAAAPKCLPMKLLISCELKVLNEVSKYVYTLLNKVK